MKECQQCRNCFPDSVETCPTDGMPTMHTIAGEPVLEGKYHLECRLGQGGMGIVYKARHAYLKTQLAIKVILPDLVGNDPQLVTRFRQEALAAAAIRHQNVVSVTDYGVIDGSLPFLVMEYVEGEALHDVLAREQSLSPEQAFDLMAAVCAGVGAAHHQGIVHRDLKPLNIMICSDKPDMSQAVKILDFGLAKIKSGELLGSFVQAQTTGLMGSPYYMAPEQWADEEPDSRADIYSLGVMFYQMLAGDVPFKGSSIPAIMKKHISDPAPTLADAGVHVSPEIEQALKHALEKDPDKRTPSVEAFISELRAAIHPGSQMIHTTSGQSLPISSLKIKSKPAQSRVFIDNVSVGETRTNGLLLLDGIQSGNHHLRDQSRRISRLARRCCLRRAAAGGLRRIARGHIRFKNGHSKARGGGHDTADRASGRQDARQPCRCHGPDRPAGMEHGSLRNRSSWRGYAEAFYIARSFGNRRTIGTLTDWGHWL